MKNMVVKLYLLDLNYIWFCKEHLKINKTKDNLYRIIDCKLRHECNCRELFPLFFDINDEYVELDFDPNKMTEPKSIMNALDEGNSEFYLGGIFLNCKKRDAILKTYDDSKLTYRVFQALSLDIDNLFIFQVEGDEKNE